MLKEGINGFCMALADRVPGVSGGTVAFIMGFYDQFICSIHDFAFGNIKEKRSALCYLAKLGGWMGGGNDTGSACGGGYGSQSH